MSFLDNNGLSSVWAKAKTFFAPISHSSANTTYGIGNTNSYGHVKLSDSISDASNTAASGGVAATPYAVKQAIDSSVTWTVL